MELGQRIKAARLEAGLSQRQLCGQVCTRNMLSLIESGRAKPSMETLRYFAGQLGRPLSWFLGEEVTASPNQAVMEKAEKALKDGDFSVGLETLGEYRGPDPVFDSSRYFLEIAFLLELADRAVQQRKFPYARGLLERVAQIGANTLYPWDRQRWLLLRFAAGEQATVIAPQLTGVPQRLLLLATAALEKGEPKQAEACLLAMAERSAEACLLLGRALLAQEQYAAAAAALQEAEPELPAQCIPLLEICYRELGNFELAYQYACKARTLQAGN